MRQELSNPRGLLPSTRSGLWMMASITVVVVMVLLAAFPTGALAESSTPVPTTAPGTAPDTSQETMGPDHYAPGINPLTGEPVLDPSMLNYPPALVSISNFPASGRPQSGLSYASIVYEMWIGEGMSRFLTIYYGNYPPSKTDQASIGDFVWSDNNHNGIQDAGEPGVPDVTVDLLNSDGVPVSSVVTDSSGAYHFNNLPAGTFSVKVELPDGATFSPKGAGSDTAKDSDFDPTTGVTDPVVLTTDAVDTVDCGLILSTPLTGGTSANPTPTATPTTSGGSDTVSSVTADDNNIGPIRSGRLPYEYVRSMYSGFLVMASAWSGVLQTLNDYTNVYGSDAGDISSDTIPVSSLKDIAKTNENQVDVDQLSGNMFDATPPAGGVPGLSLWVNYNFLNQFFWRYNPATGGYNRYQNDTVAGTKFTELTDKITGDPLNYQNVIVLFANNTAPKETLVDITLQYAHGKAALFRDGQEYPILWTSENGSYEQSTGQVRPIRFTDLNGDPIALKPGQTWVVIVNSYTPFYETMDTEDFYKLAHDKTPGSGYWAAYFSDPYSAQ